MTIEKAIAEFEEYYFEEMPIRKETYKLIIEALQFQQSVVRCKDCDLRYQYPQNVFCNRHIGKVHDDGFCFEGKQREEKE